MGNSLISGRPGSINQSCDFIFGNPGDKVMTESQIAGPAAIHGTTGEKIPLQPLVAIRS
jgi:hypothetical protein